MKTLYATSSGNEEGRGLMNSIASKYFTVVTGAVGDMTPTVKAYLYGHSEIVATHYDQERGRFHALIRVSVEGEHTDKLDAEVRRLAEYQAERFGSGTFGFSAVGDRHQVVAGHQEQWGIDLDAVGSRA